MTTAPLMPSYGTSLTGADAIKGDTRSYTSLWDMIFKAGDNAGYNSELLSNLVEANEGGKFNKPILLQAASLIEVAAIQIFYRAQNYNLEGVPNDKRSKTSKSTNLLW